MAIWKAIMANSSTISSNRATLDGKNLGFITETVHGVSFEFKGTIERGPGKNPGDEAYYVLKGTLIQNTTDANKKTSSKSREV